MARSVAKAILIGHVGQDPEIKTLGNGNKIARFNMATSKSWKDKETGDRKERTSWHRIVVYAKPLIESVFEKGFVKKGSLVFVEASIEQREYEQGDEKRSITEFLIDGYSGRLELLEKREGGGGRAPEAPDEFYDDLPFGG